MAFEAGYFIRSRTQKQFVYNNIIILMFRLYGVKLQKTSMLPMPHTIFEYIKKNIHALLTMKKLMNPNKDKRTN